MIECNSVTPLQYTRHTSAYRFDFVRGYGGQFVREYVLATEPYFAVGEYWDSLDYDGNVPKLNQDRHRQQTIDWITAAGGAATAFDVTTKGILHAVFEVNLQQITFTFRRKVQRNPQVHLSLTSHCV